MRILIVYRQSYFFDNLYNVLIVELMIFTHFLRIEFDGSSPNHTVSKIPNHIPVYFITKIFDSAPKSLNNDWLLIIGIFSFRFGINPNQIEILPHSVNKLIQIPSKITSDGHIMLNLIQNVQLIKSYGINFV